MAVRHSGFRWRPTPWFWKYHVSVTVAASFVDQKLEQNVTIFRLITGRLGRHGAQFRVIQKGGLAPHEKLAAASKCVGHAVVECIPTSLAEVMAFRRRRLHEHKEPSAADDWRDRVDPRRANVPNCCQVGRGSNQALCPKVRQIGCLGLEVIPTWHEFHSVSLT